jgi:glycosyltransferase involved in cell wall biosynthesis
MATVTVFIPTYNRPDLIGLAIESALAQTFEDIEILIGDNAGSELTPEVVGRYDDPRIRYVRHEVNKGAQGNWLWLIDNAASPLVASLHDDDIWEPTFLERTVPALLADPSVSMVFTDSLLIDGDGVPLHAETAERTRRNHMDRIPAGRLDVDLSQALQVVAVWNAPQPAFAAVMRRSAVQATEFPPEVDPVYDMWVSYQMVRRGERLFYVPEKLTRYRVWPGSITGSVGFSAPEDVVFGHIVNQNPTLSAEVRTEIRRYWAELRYGRAGKWMADRSHRAASQRELSESAPDLTGARRGIALVGGRSRVAWEVLRFAREGSRRGPAGLRHVLKRVNKVRGG